MDAIARISTANLTAHGSMECTSIKVSYYVCFQVSLTVLDTLHEKEMDLTTSLLISMHQIKVTKKIIISHLA